MTKLVDLLRNTIGKEKTDGTWGDRPVPRWVWQVCGFAIGIGLAYAFEVNAFSGTGERNWGPLLTGLAIGAAGSGYHELFDALSGVAKAKHSQAKAAQPPPGQ
ncbi:hypothetical protein [Kribbella sp. NPDC049584]|uniref:hypothetical protein n=1 Tax=Kribbella sp. NPDC049584 TaxID=3154833 RepID=UPI0034283E3A